MIFGLPFLAMAWSRGSMQKLASKVFENHLDSTLRVAQSAPLAILDNAPYHRGSDVRALLARLYCRTQLIRLPPSQSRSLACEHALLRSGLSACGRSCTRTSPTIDIIRHKKFANPILRFFRKTIPKRLPGFRDQNTNNFRIISHQNLRVLE
jgi:hypothetical protein